MRAQAGVKAIYWIESRENEGLRDLCSKKSQMIIRICFASQLSCHPTWQKKKKMKSKAGLMRQRMVLCASVYLQNGIKDINSRVALSLQEVFWRCKMAASTKMIYWSDYVISETYFQNENLITLYISCLKHFNDSCFSGVKDEDLYLTPG